MTKVWITRTSPAADESADIWRAAGFDPQVEPLLSVQSVPHEALNHEELLIFTSKNAVDHIACNGQRAICVGDATAQHARNAGFTNVVSVDGTSADVTDWVRVNLKRERAVTHVSGKHVRGSIVEDLREAGFPARRRIVYRSMPRKIWPASPASLVALYSPLAARVFVELAESQSLSGLSAVCISPATAEELKSAKLKSVLIAAWPREDELIIAAKTCIETDP